MSLVGKLHNQFVYSRRIRVLVSQLCELIPENAKILDVGCGDGNIDKIIMEMRPDVTISGIDIMIRPNTFMTIEEFDGATIPYDDDSFDLVMFIDVIHHTANQQLLLEEAKRVSRKYLLLKDHTNDGLLAFSTLKFMDWVGNRHHGVVLPYNYWDRKEWMDTFKKLSLSIEDWRSDFKLYPIPASWLFDRSLHFISLISK